MTHAGRSGRGCCASSRTRPRIAAGGAPCGAWTRSTRGSSPAACALTGRRNAGRWRNGCGRRSRSCPSDGASRSCCSTSRAIRTRRSPTSSGFPKARCAPKCSTRGGGCARCSGIGRRTHEAGLVAIRRPARSGDRRRAATRARPGRSPAVRRAGAGARRAAADGLVGQRARPLGAGRRRRGHDRRARRGLSGGSRRDGGARTRHRPGRAARPVDASGPRRSGVRLRHRKLERRDTPSCSIAPRHGPWCSWSRPSSPGSPSGPAAGRAAASPEPLAAQQLEVTLPEAVRRALDVQPAVVQARGAVTTAGWQKRVAYGAFLPTVTLNSSASRQNAATVGGIGVQIAPGTYTYNTGLTASIDLFTGFKRLANYKNADATEDANDAGLTNERYLVTAATAQLFYTALANDELVPGA